MAEGVNPPTEGDGDLPEQPHSTELEPVARELEPRKSSEIGPYTPYEQAHVHKFRLVTAALAGFGLAAVAAAAIFLVAGRPPKPPQWSEWKPNGGGEDALKQIADHIAPNYRMADGQQLVAVEGGPLQIAGLPVRVVLHPNANDYTPLSGKGALFILCGMGTKCSIKSGKPSVERMLLLRREALELALYTFRYVKDVKQVVVLLPPGRDKKTGTVPDPSVAMFFRRGDVNQQLAQPLHFTLPSPPPSIPSLKAGATKDFIDRLTGREIFNFELQQGQDASVFLFLAPPDSTSTSSGSGGSSSSTGTTGP
jgi:hypothetical protein